MKNKMGLRKFVNNIYGFSFFNALMVLMPVYAIFMQEHGVSDMQLSTLFMMYCVGVAVFQFPAAWINRLLGHKKTIIIGQIIKIISFIIWFMVPNYLGFAIGMLLWGLQGAIYNVSYESLLYDELNARKNRSIYAKVLGRRKALSTIGAALSAAGSLLLFMGYNAILYFTIISVVIGTIFIMRIEIISVKKPTKSKPKRQVSFFKILRTGCSVVTHTPCILYMLLLTAMLSNFSYLDDYFSVIGLEIGLHKEYVGLVAFFIMCCQMIGQNIAHHFEKIKDRTLYILISLAGLVFVSFSMFYSVAGLLLLGFAYIMFSALNVLTFAKFQDFVPTSCRPIALSLYSMVDSTLFLGTLFLFGLASGLGGWRYSILLMGMLSAALGLWAILFVKDKCTVREMPVKVGSENTHTDSVSSVSPSQF